MNKKQRACLSIGLVLIVIMLLYPPWIIPKTSLSERYRYAFITERPGNINRKRLWLQVGVVAFITAGYIVSLKGKKAKTANSGV